MSVKRLVLLALVVTSCHKKQETRAPAPPWVSVETAIAQDMPYVIRTFGQAVAWNSVAIMPQVAGELMEYFFADGAWVNEGDLLATIDPRLYQAQLEEAEGLLEQSRASLSYNLDRLRRYKDLLPDDYVSILDYEEFLSNTELAMAQVEQHEGTVAAAQVNLGYTEIRSPISGRTSVQIVDPGNIVYPDESTYLTIINQISPIEVDFQIPQRYLFDLQQHQTPDGLEIEASFIDDPSQKWSGKLIFFDNQISTTTGTLKCEALYPNDDLTMWPGMWVNVTLKVYTIPDAVMVPTQAIGTDTHGQFVFVIKSGDIAEQRRIKLGQRFDAWQIVESGVEKGEQVVTSGQLMLRTGRKVRVRD